MKTKLALAASIAAMVAAMAWPGNADQLYRTPHHDPYGARGGVGEQQVLANIRNAGFSPSGPLVRRGDVFVAHGIDPRGTEVRIVADTAFGDILQVAPIGGVAPALLQQYDAGPRIIRVPDRVAALDSQAMQPRGDAVDLDETDDTPTAAVSPVSRRKSLAPARPATLKQKPQAAVPPRHKIDATIRRHSALEPVRRFESEPAKQQAALTPPVAAPAPPQVIKPVRSVLNVPPAGIEGPSPIRPTPRWGSAAAIAPAPVVAQAPAVAADIPGSTANAAEPVASPPAAAADLPPEGATFDPPLKQAPAR